MTMTSEPKRKVTLCPTCGQPSHRDPITGKYTKHAAIEIIPLAPKATGLEPPKRWRDTTHPELAGIPPREPEPERKRRGLFRRRPR